jgi:glycosyltransferase involved in cell wall biosynthesis
MIESMLCGTPVIAFPRGSVPEVVEHGVTGFIVGSVEEMADAIRDVGTLDRRAVRARAEQRWTHLRMARDYLAVYQAAIERYREQGTRPSILGSSDPDGRVGATAGAGGAGPLRT